MYAFVLIMITTILLLLTLYIYDMICVGVFTYWISLMW